MAFGHPTSKRYLARLTQKTSKQLQIWVCEEFLMSLDKLQITTEETVPTKPFVELMRTFRKFKEEDEDLLHHS